MPQDLKKNIETRSGCPVSCTLEFIGDKWSLLIIRDMLFSKKSTYNEFLNSPEKIATNILNDRLIKLAETGLITYTGTAKRKIYSLTKMGLDLKSVLEAIAIFGMKHVEGTREYMQERLKDPGQ